MEAEPKITITITSKLTFWYKLFQFFLWLRLEKPCRWIINNKPLIKTKCN